MYDSRLRTIHKDGVRLGGPANKLVNRHNYSDYLMTLSLFETQFYVV
jgi:hypothetical protein